MANETPYILEERIVTKVWVYERHNTGDTLDKSRERFKKNPPTRKTMSNREKKTFETGNMKNASRSRRPMTRIKSCANVEQSINISPLKSTRKRSAQLGILRTTMRSFIKKYQEVEAWRR